MKQKLISLLTLLLCVCSGAWSEEHEPTYSIGATEQTSSTFLGTDVISGITLSSTASYSSGAVQLGNTPSAYDQHYFEVLSSKGAIEKVSFLISGNGSDKSIKAPVFGWAEKATSNTADTYCILDAVTVSANSYAAAKWFEYDFSAYDVKCLRIYRTTKNISSTNPPYTGSSTALGSGQTIKIYGIKIWLKAAGPSITTQPVSASYVTGAAATALSVEASASSGELSYQWYSNTSETTEGATALSGETNATYTPNTASSGKTYYFCAVTDANGTVNSSFATITVSAASAPSDISVSGASSAARGDDDITLTAVVTGGVPAPTIEWFKCDDALGTNPVPQGVASTSNTTFDVATTTVGTYYYLAKAANATGNVSSDVKTITIVPKAPTMTAGGVFVTDSKDIEIEKDGDEDDSAVIKYSIGDSESWTVFTSLNITETTTVKAKVVQDGLESDVVSATYTKVVLEELTSISCYTKWDWADLAGHYTANNGTDIKMADDHQGDSKAVDVLMSNIPKYGRYTIDYPSSFDAQSLLFNGEYPVRKQGDNYVGGAVYLKITTTVPGLLTITYADNGTNNRYVRVTDSTNEPKDGEASSSTTDYKTKTFEVAAGNIRIAGYTGSAESYIRFKTIIFQPTTTVTVGAKGYATYVNSDYTLDFTGKSIKVYTIGSADGTTLTLTQKDKVAKDEPVLLYSNTESDSQTIPAIADGEATVDATNKLVAGDGNTHTYEAGVTEHYILYTGGEKPGFYRANNSLVAVGKAYLDLTGVGGGARIMNFDLFMEDGVATGIAEMKSVNAENNGIFNLRGQRVAQPQKGLYIMNGKKVVVK